MDNQIRKKIRAACGQSGTPYPIEIVDGDNPPRLVGESSGYVTRGGRKIYHPSAYSKRGWSNMVYSPSTMRIEVGQDWIDNNYSSTALAVS